MEQLINTVLTSNGPSARHLVTLFGIALSMRPKRILELGVLHGETTLPLLMAAGLIDGHVTSIDICPTSFVPPENLKSRWTFHQMDAVSFLKNQTERFDLVYVDDSHVYEHVKEELNLLEPLVTCASVIILHDLMHHNTQPVYNRNWDRQDDFRNGGPFRAVNELPDTWEWATIPANNGLTILRRKI